MEKFLKIKEEYLNAPNIEISNEKLSLLRQMIEDEPEKYAEAFLEISQQKLDELKELNIKLALQEVSEFISFSYIAKNYFNKSKEWFYQRVNGYIVNGKPAKFTEEEIDILNLAIQDLSNKLGSVRVA